VPADLCALPVFDLRNPHLDQSTQLVGHLETMLCAHRFEAPMLRGFQVDGEPF